MIHDNPEARIGDQDKVGARYCSNHEADQKAFSEQLDDLGDVINKKWTAYFSEYEERRTKESIIAKDANWLEQAFQAKEYLDCGFASAIDWINNVEQALETKSAKLLIKQLREIKFTDWWSGLKKMTHKNSINKKTEMSPFMTLSGFLLQLVSCFKSKIIL